jgi:hypothetical protein
VLPGPRPLLQITQELGALPGPLWPPMTPARWSEGPGQQLAILPSAQGARRTEDMPWSPPSRLHPALYRNPGTFAPEEDASFLRSQGPSFPSETADKSGSKSGILVVLSVIGMKETRLSACVIFLD